MSPEQARGEAIDRSVDIWAYGVVIYEMLTGHLLFARRSAAETISAVLTEEPDWDRIPEGSDVWYAAASRRIRRSAFAISAMPGCFSRISRLPLLSRSRIGSRGLRPLSPRCWPREPFGRCGERQLLHPNRYAFTSQPTSPCPGAGRRQFHRTVVIWHFWNRSRRHAARVGPGFQCPGRPRSSSLEARPGSGPAFLVSRQSVHCLRRRRRAQKNRCVWRFGPIRVCSEIASRRRIVEQRRHHHHRDRE